jgi:hypothetical protein
MSPLKFFRKYDKWLISIGMTVLMILFLIEPTLSMLQPDTGKQELGRTRLGKITMGEQRAAGNDMEILSSISPLMIYGIDKSDALAWTLMLQEAQSMGLSAGDYEVEVVLRNLDFKDGALDPRLKQFAASRGTNTAGVVEAVRHWLIIQSYRELTLGLGKMQTADRIQLLTSMSRYMTPEILQNPMLRQFIEQQFHSVGMASAGSPRLSEPLIKRFLYDQRATLRVAAVVIPATLYADKAPAPDEAALKALFDQYKDKLPGEGEPYGLGYKQPPRVKLEWLSLPLDRLLAKVQVDEADALSFYDANATRFTVEVPPPASQPASTQPEQPKRRQQAYEEVRDRVFTQLRRQRASELGAKIAKAVTSTLQENVRTLPMDSGYRAIGPGFEPVPLSVAAEQVFKQFGVRMDVVRRDDRYLTRSDIAELPGLGEVAIGQGATLADYILSARELKSTDARFATLRFQVGVPSEPISGGSDEAVYILRLIDAKPTEVPSSLLEVKPQVQRDAQLLAGYKQLLANTDSWQRRAVTEGLPALAKELKTTVINPPAFTRRDPRTGGTLAPELPGIGRSIALVDRAFDVAARASERAATQPGKPADRVDAVPVDGRLALVLVRVEQFQPMNEMDYIEAQAQIPMIAPQIQEMLLRSQFKEPPLSRAVLEKRLGFEYAGGKRERAATEPADAP